MRIPTINFYQDKGHAHRWTLKHGNGKILAASSEGFLSKSNAKRNFLAVRNAMAKIAFALSLLLGSQALAADTNAEIKTAVISFVQTASTNRTVTAAVYPSYAPDIVVDGKKDNFGFGAAVLTPVSIIPGLGGISDNVIVKHSFVGLRFDYLGHQAFASTVGVGMKGDFQLWGHNIEAFAQSGANIPFSGFSLKNGEIGAMAGGGLYTSLWTFTHGTLGLQVSAEHWTQFPGVIYHGGPVLTISF